MAVRIEKIHLRDAANNWAALPDWTYTNNGTTTSVSELFVNNKKVTQAVTTANANYPIILKTTTATATVTDTTIFGSKITANPSTGNLAATKFNNLTLSAATTGFTISGGTTSKTLTVPATITLAAAAGKGVVTAVTSASEDLPTSKAVDTAISSAILAANVPAVSSATPQAVATVAATGTATAYARADHVHAITSATITTALTYTPLGTQSVSKNIVGGSTTATANVSVTTNGIYLNHLEDTSVQSSHKIIGKGGTTVTATTSDNDNIITINSTTYSAMTTAAATTGTETTGHVITAKVLHGERASWYGTTTIGATITAKAVTTATVTVSNVTYDNTDLVGYKLKKGSQIVVNFINANTVTNADLTLNIAGTGAKPIFVDGATVSSGNQFLWDAGTEIEFIYDGSYYRVICAPIDNATISAIVSS